MHYLARLAFYLNNSHAQPRLLGELLPDVTGRLGSLIERRLQNLQLFCLDGGSGPPSLASWDTMHVRL